MKFPSDYVAGCHLPGNVCSPEDLWQLIVDQRTAQGAVPPDRYNIDGFYHPQGGNRSGSTNVPGGYFINEDIRQFDNNFFGINNLEATYMDPQQRKLLEVVLECLQSSGTKMDSVSDSNTGVYVANFSVDYQPGQTRDPDYLHRYTATGSGATVMSNRISHVFNLQGPSFTVDTACSSSIYALHQALNALKIGDCDSAIVASANLMMSPELHIGAAKSGVLSPTGASHTFDVSADGYGRAEGVSAIYVKRLSAALRDGNPIRAVIRGSVVNASGRTSGISLPSAKMQELVMRKAYKDAGLDIDGTDYVECHGTGTATGDPIEVDAVIKAFENSRIPPSYGVVNLNPKLILKERNLKVATKLEKWPRALRRGSINSFGYGGANGHIILESADSYLHQDHLLNLTIGERTNRVHANGVHANDVYTNGVHTNGVNANGVHTNGAHTNGTHTNGVHTNCTPTNGVQTNDIHANGISRPEGDELLVLPVSAASTNSLKTLVQKISQTVSECDGMETLQSIAHTLSKGRDHLRYRNFLLASYDEPTGKFTATAEEAANSAIIDPLPFGFVFTGQGAQYAGMAKELLSQSQHFRNTIHDLDNVLQTLPAPYTPSWTLEQTLLDGPKISRINEVTRSQPICTAVQVGLVNMLRSWGIKPTSVVGHSSGEIAAAYAAGFLSASQAIMVAYFRGYAVGELRTQGAMMAAGLSPRFAQSLIESKGLQTQVRVACVNAPENVTLSGSLDAIEDLMVELESNNKFVRKLETGGRAYHSHMMEEIGQLYEDLLTPVIRRQHDKAMAKAVVARSDSSSLGTAEEVKLFSSVGHNPDGLRPVQFSAVLASLAAEGKKIRLIEVGPHSSLKGPIEQIRKAISLNEKSLPYLSTLVRNEDASMRIKTLAGRLFTQGYGLVWDHVNGLDILSKQPRKLKILHDLAPYPWDYSSGLLWSEPRASVELRNRKHIRHELLGTAALTGNGIDFTWRNILKPSEMPWIKDHKLEDQVVFPAAGYIAIAIEAVSQIAGIKKQLKERQHHYGFELRNVNVSAALNVPDENDSAAKDLELHTTMSLRKISGTNTSVDWHDFSISSFFWTSGQATLHCTGSIRIIRSTREVDSTGITVDNAEGFDLWSSTSRWYTKWLQEGLCFGPQFQSLTSLRTDSLRQRHEAIATTRIEPALVSSPYEFYPVHPITIDAGLQAACLSGTAGHVAALKTWLPVFVAECYIQPSTSAAPNSDAEGEIHVKCEEMGFSSRRIEGTIWDASRTPIVDFKDSRISLYTGKDAIAVAMQQSQAGVLDTGSASASLSNHLDLYMQRQPTLRVQWKPDVLRLSLEAGAQLRQYVVDFVEQQHPDVRDDESLAVIGALLQLAGHKTPRMRVLELGGDAQGYKAKQWLNMLGKETAFPLCRSWHTGDFSENGEVSIKDNVEGPFEVVVLPKHATLTSRHVCTTIRERISSLVGEQGVVVARKSDVVMDGLQSAGFDVLDVGKQVLLAIRPLLTTGLHGRNALILVNPSSAILLTGPCKSDHHFHEDANNF
ncbi:hypothetical protein MMC07_007034 [Pseudocyphellaria aurata]|nr:hypothetical protein [Pseudocyphellaria aurata]